MMQFCLISPGHVASNPRLVKEADALVEKGYEVKVIYGQTHEPTLKYDIPIISKAKWRAIPVSLFHDDATLKWFPRLRHRFAFILAKSFFRSATIAAVASHPLFSALRKAALRESADFYIGHCLAALPIACVAAEKHKAIAGFDAEDLHSGENLDEGNGAVLNEIARTLEAAHLPRITHLTAASPLIAEYYESRYHREVVPILNTFTPDKQAILKSSSERCSKPKFYWFSQTVGLNRGLEEFVGIMNELNTEVRIDLRGHVSSVVQKKLESLAGHLVDIYFLPPAPADEMVPLAAGYTAGLALEQTMPMNRNVCLTNKAFTYLAAGTPVIFSHTTAQRKLAGELGMAALEVELSNTRESAKKISDWIHEPSSILQAQETAVKLGETTFSWEVDKERLLQTIEAHFQ